MSQSKIDLSGLRGKTVVVTGERESLLHSFLGDFRLIFRKPPLSFTKI